MTFQYVFMYHGRATAGWEGISWQGRKWNEQSSWNVFVQITQCFCPNYFRYFLSCIMYLSTLQNVFFWNFEIYSWLGGREGGQILARQEMKWAKQLKPAHHTDRQKNIFHLYSSILETQRICIGSGDLKEYGISPLPPPSFQKCVPGSKPIYIGQIQSLTTLGLLLSMHA